MFTKDGVLQDNFLEKFNQLVWQVSSHESFYGTRDILRILSFRQRGLYDLINKLSAEWVIFKQNIGPEIRITTADEVSSFAFE